MTTVGQLPLGESIRVGDRQLWAHRAGSGGPGVVFVPGGGSFGLDFLLAHELAAEVSTSIIYDRAGTGWSVDVELPRSADAVTDELRALLGRLEIPPPYLLVGHSLGGLYVQRYAQRFPTEVAAMLLLEPAHEDWDRYQPEYLQIARNQPTNAELPDLPTGFQVQIRELLLHTFDKFPESLRELVVDRHLSPERLPTGFREGLNLVDVFDELRAGGARPDVPMIILSGTAVDVQQTMFLPAALVREQIAGSERLFDALAAATPRGEHRTLEDASHITIPMSRPDAVAVAVKDLLDRIDAPVV
jgi:pimeloyl-ACP methyl ester carboxylesterase